MVTGQESPELVEPMREDTYMRRMSDDRIACRLPCAGLTKMVSPDGQNTT